MSNSHPTIGIFGLGRFGRLAASILKEHGRVKVYKFKPEDARYAGRIGAEAVGLAEAAGCDYVLLCAPISATENLIKRITKHVKPGALVMDTCSVKTYPCRWLRRHIPKATAIMGTHPMFGPTTARFDPDKGSWDIKGKQVVLCPLRVDPGRLASIRRFLAGLGLEVIEATPAEHDKQNAYSLGLVHYIGRALKASGVKEQSIYTPGFQDLLRITPHTTGDNWQLFYDMHNYNPYAEAVRLSFVQSCLDLDRRVHEQSVDTGIKRLRFRIDAIDRLVVRLLEGRMQAATLIGKHKKAGGQNIRDSRREKQITDRLARFTSLSGPFVRQLYELIFRESRRRQK